MALRKETVEERLPAVSAADRFDLAGAAHAAGENRRILFVIGTLDLGGSESQLVLLATELKKRGWAPEVFSLSSGGALAKPLRQAGIPVFFGPHRASPTAELQASTNMGVAPTVKPSRRPSIRAMATLAHAETWLISHIIATRPAVVHAILPLTNFLGAIAGRVAFAPLVITSRRALGHHQERWPRLKRIDRVANRLSHVVVANSLAVAKDTAKRDGYDLARIAVIPNGLDLARFDDNETARAPMRSDLGIAEGDIAVAMVANLILYKGHRELVEALALATKEDGRLRLFLVGQDRGIGSILLDDARRLGVSASVHLLGRREDVPCVLAAMDVGVIASHEEGFCNALLEKLAAGLPVVATDVGGNPEALAGMPGCELVRPHDPSDLARGLLSVVRRLPETRGDCDFRRQAIRQRYSVGAMVDAFERLYLTRARGRA